MTDNNLLKKQEQIIFKAMSAISNKRAQDVLVSRYGLDDGRKKTLEEIGRKYNITRERVRQIEEAAFSDLRRPEMHNLFKPVFNSVDVFLNKEGKLAREERLFSALTGTETPHRLWGGLYFVLTLGKSYQRFVESEKFHSLWTNSASAVQKADSFVNRLMEVLNERKEIIPLAEVHNLAKSFGLNFSKRALCSYLDATKQVSQNYFGGFGLSHWPEINPRGAKDKAFLILKQYKKPLHFREIANYINQANLGSYPAQPQTVHNELIKDPRFVLVGRGVYGLKEWGHRQGTIKDVIITIIQEKGPMTREEVVGEVLRDRMVKKNTVFINLQNKKYFGKNGEGKYTLALSQQ